MPRFQYGERFVKILKNGGFWEGYYLGSVTFSSGKRMHIFETTFGAWFVIRED